MDRRKKALELFNTCGIKDTAINWHLWKRAFDLGYSFANEQKQIVDLVEDTSHIKCEHPFKEVVSGDEGDFCCKCQKYLKTNRL